MYAMKDNSITISNLTEGTHRIRIFREKKRNGNGFGASRKQEVIYSNGIFLKRGFHLDITVNRFGKVLVDERRIDRNDDWFDYEDGDYDSNEGYDDGSFGNNVMSSIDFAEVKESISKEWMESNKLQSTRFIIDRNNFTTMQVRELMLLFSFESNKLEVAKYAYRKTVDKHKYYLVNDVFSFNSSKDELARFLRESR
jgi:hypothetical protein